MPRWLTLLLLLGLLQAQELRISLNSSGQDLSSILALCATLTEVDYRCEQAVAQDYAASGDGLILLDQVPLGAAHQALAHVTDSWWSYGEGGAVVFSRSPGLPLLGTSETRVVTSMIDHRRELIQACERIMAPWTTHPACGLTYHAPAHRWMARLDNDGHRQLNRLLACLEHPRVDVPQRLPPLQIPPRLTSIPALAASDVRQLAADLHAQGIPVAVHADALRQPGELRIAGGTVTSLPVRIQSQGLSAAWRDGVLCIGLKPVRIGEHPGQNLRLARIPVAQFGDHLAGEAMALRLRHETGDEQWRLPGHAMLYLPEHRALLVACRPRLLETVLATIDRLDDTD